MEPYTNPQVNSKNLEDGPLNSTNSATRLRQTLAHRSRCLRWAQCKARIRSRFRLLVSEWCRVATLNDFVEAARIHCSINPAVPVIADADTGFGGPNMIARTVTQYARSSTRKANSFNGGIRHMHSCCGGWSRFTSRVFKHLIIARTDAAQSSAMKEAINRLKLA
ncbi:oxaloacetate acetylhydrolase [Lentinula edodes]|uniref:Oxaloacetate acetylhydrolase n=1 Tax=Lentinula edodes TaxID=5353 RepID=A0A1Q3DYN0_LENED|nr:oxaloacetate acetylhydrolase [Lentinula edodes]